MSISVPLEPYVIRSLLGEVVPGEPLYVVERGDPGRTINGQNLATVQLTETVVPIYSDPELTDELTQPVTANDKGRYPYWIGADSVDLYSPNDITDPIQPLERPPGWPWRDGGFRAGRKGRPLPGPTGQRAAIVDFFVASDEDLVMDSRVHAGSGVSLPEQGDPSEVQMRRIQCRGGPGWPIYDDGDETEWWHHSFLAADVLADVTEAYVAFGSWLADEIGILGGNSEFAIGDQQPITYEGKQLVATVLCSAHDAGATELIVARTDQLPPAPGILWNGRRKMYIYYEGKETLLSTTLASDYQAGDTTLELTSVAGLPPVGSIFVALSGGQVQTRRYTEIVGDTLTLAQGLNRNAPAGNAASVGRLTGITTREALPMNDPDTGDPVFDQSGVPIPAADRLAREAVVHTGLFTDLPDNTRIGCHKLTGVGGLVGGVSKGATVMYNPDSPGSVFPVTAKNLALGLVGGQSGGPGNFNRSSYFAFTTEVAQRDQKHRAGRITALCVQSRSGLRLNMMYWTSRRTVGNVGQQVGDPSQTIYPLHMQPWAARVENPGTVVTDPEESDDDEDPTDPDPGQFTSALVIFVNSTEGAPESGRVVVNAHNLLTSTNEDVEFDYSSLVASSLIDGGITLPAETITIDSTVGFTDDGEVAIEAVDGTTQHVAYGLKTATQLLDCEGGHGAIADGATVIQNDGIGLRGITYDGAGSINDFYLPGGNQIKLADRVKAKTIVAHRGQVSANDTQEAETRMGNIGPTAANPEPGVSMGLTSPLDIFRRADGKVGAKHTTTGETTLATEAYADAAPGLAVLPAARVRHSTTQSITTATVVTLAFDTEDYDTGGLHDTVTNNSRLIAPTPGLYTIRVAISWAANSTGRRVIQLLLNGTTLIAEGTCEPASSANTAHAVSTDYVLAADDFVEASVFQTSGGNLAVQSDSAGKRFPVLSMRYVGAAS